MEKEDKYTYLALILEGIAHEIRNPMQGILASVAVLKTRLEDDEATRPFLEMVQRDTSRINELINQMMVLARNIRFDQRKHSVAGLMQEAIRSLEPIYEARGGHISLETRGTVDAIRVDSQAMTAAFGALLLNAVESKDKGAQVSVLIGGDDRFLTVTITDDGEGIAGENLPRIFEPFFSTKPKKAGLGLCLADRCLCAHGAEVRVQSTPGKGTEMTILFPREA